MLLILVSRVKLNIKVLIEFFVRFILYSKQKSLFKSFENTLHALSSMNLSITIMPFWSKNPQLNQTWNIFSWKLSFKEKRQILKFQPFSSIMSYYKIPPKRLPSGLFPKAHIQWMPHSYMIWSWTSALRRTGPRFRCCCYCCCCL